MARTRWASVILSMVVAASGLMVEAYQPEIRRPLTPEEAEIEFAGGIADPEERRVALRRALEKGLLESDTNTRSDVYQYLHGASAWLDLSPYTDILIRLAAQTNRDSYMWLADRNRLHWMAREERSTIYRRAMEEGEVRLRFGLRFSRRMAAEAAAREGIDELLPEIQEYCSRQPSEDRLFSPCEDLILMSEFRGGGHEGKSAIYAAAERFSEVDDQRFWSLMNFDPSWNRVFLRTASSACAPDQLTGEVSEACAVIGEIAADQFGLFRARLAAAANGSLAARESLERVWPVHWLARLQRLVGGPDLSSYWFWGLEAAIRYRESSLD